MRRAGQQNDDLFFALIPAADPLPGGAAIGVRQDHGPGNHVRLLEIVGGHVLPAPRREAAFQAGDNFRIAAHFQSQRIRHGFTGEIVFSRSQAAHEDHDFGARQAQAGRSREMFAAVAHDGLENYLDAQQIQLFREVKGIRVLTEGRQQLRANGDDLGIHG